MFREPIFIGIEIIGERVVCKRDVLLVVKGLELYESRDVRLELLSLYVLKKILSEIVLGIEYWECDLIGRLLYR